MTYLVLKESSFFPLVFKCFVDPHGAIHDITLGTHAETNTTQSIVGVPQRHHGQRFLELRHVYLSVPVETERQGLVRQDHHRIIRPVATLVRLDHRMNSNGFRRQHDVAFYTSPTHT